MAHYLLQKIGEASAHRPLYGQRLFMDPSMSPPTDRLTRATIEMPRGVGESPGRPSSSAGGSLVGAQLGPYQVLLKLSSGGMASVYLARAMWPERFVALKSLKPKWAGERRHMEMFLDEARIMSLIHHPNVCRFIDAG